jgi:hypothetical protein
MGVAAGSPPRIAAASAAISSGVKPDRAATAGLTWNVTAGPLIASSTPFKTSTTPETLLMASALHFEISDLLSGLSCNFEKRGKDGARV